METEEKKYIFKKLQEFEASQDQTIGHLTRRISLLENDTQKLHMRIAELEKRG